MPRPVQDAERSLAPRWWIEPAALWLAHHVVFLAALYLGAALVPARHHIGLANPQAGPADLVPFFRDYARQPERHTAMIGREAGGDCAWALPLVRWDAWWLLQIAESGYTARADKSGAHNVVYFPLFPFLVGVLHRLGVPVIVGSLAINAAALFAALLLVYRLQWERGGKSLARWTVIFWLAFPASFYAIVRIFSIASIAVS